MARNRIIYGSQSVWCNGELLYRVQTLGSTATFTSEDIFELGHLDIIDVVDDVPAVAVTLNTNDWGDVKTMAMLSQVAAPKIGMELTAGNDNANLAVVSGTNLAETGTYLHGACLADFAVTCGNLAGVSLWAPVQSECDLGTLADDIEQSLFMDEVYVNSLEFSYTTGANATENYGAETDQKMWLLNDGRFINYEECDHPFGASFTIASGVTIATLTDNTLGFLRQDANGARAVTWYDDSANEMTNIAVVAGTSQAADTFVYQASIHTLHVPSNTAIFNPASDDKLFMVYAADGYVGSMGNKYFELLDVVEDPSITRPGMIGAVRQGQVEIYILADTDLAFANTWRLTGCTISSDLTREPLAELGHLGPYDRPLTVPIPITVTVDTTAGDLEHWSRFAKRYSEFDLNTMVDINLADLTSADDLKLVIKVYAQTDEEAGGSGANRTIDVNSELIGLSYFNNGTKGTYAAAGATEYALKTIVVEHLKITDEAYTLDMGTNATQTFGFRSTNDLYVVKGDLHIDSITDGRKIRRNG